MPSTRKCAAIIRKHRDALEAFLCNPRPEGLLPSLAWGIGWDFEGGANGAIAGAILTVWCVKPEHVLPAGQRGAYGAALLTETAWQAVLATCETIAQECGWARGTVRPNYGADLERRDTPKSIAEEQVLAQIVRQAERQPTNTAPMFE